MLTWLPFRRGKDGVERSITDRINRRNRWLAFCAFIVVGAISGLTRLVLHEFHDSIAFGHFEKVYLLILLILFLTNGITWGIRGAQRQDLYTTIKEKSLMQLKRFQSEIEDVIEELEEDESRPKSKGKRPDALDKEK